MFELLVRHKETRGVGGLASGAEQTRAASGPLALILSPTRELAVQTVEFVRSFAEKLRAHAPALGSLRVTLLLGGDPLGEQFAALSARPAPDLLVATPGRLLHVLSEMRLAHPSVRYVVLDEADRCALTEYLLVSSTYISREISAYNQ